VGRTKCDIHDGSLRIVFEKDNLGTNIYDSTARIDEAVNEAGKSKSGGSAMSIVARRSIKSNFDVEISNLIAKIEKILALSSLRITVNFDDVYSKVHKYAKNDSSFNSAWEQSFGDTIASYFQGLVYQLQCKKFAEDEMMQEAFREAVDKNEIVFRVVDKLERGYNQALIEGGVLILQTDPPNWYVNSDDIGSNLPDLL
jgi:hypothetical protein